MHRITDLRMGGTSRKNFRLFRKLCGDKTLKNVIITTNMWNQVELDVGEARELELMTDEILFKPVLDGGAHMRRHNGSQQSALEILGEIVANHPKALLIQEELVDQKKDITETTAAEELDRGIMELKRRQEKELLELKEQLAEAKAELDIQTQEELEKAREEMEDSLRKLGESRALLSQGYADEKVKGEETIRRLMEELRVQAGSISVPEFSSKPKVITSGDAEPREDSISSVASVPRSHNDIPNDRTGFRGQAQEHEEYSHRGADVVGIRPSDVQQPPSESCNTDQIPAPSTRLPHHSIPHSSAYTNTGCLTRWPTSQSSLLTTQKPLPDLPYGLSAPLRVEVSPRQQRSKCNLLAFRKYSRRSDDIGIPSEPSARPRGEDFAARGDRSFENPPYGKPLLVQPRAALHRVSGVASDYPQYEGRTTARPQCRPITWAGEPVTIPPHRGTRRGSIWLVEDRGSSDDSGPYQPADVVSEVPNQWTQGEEALNIIPGSFSDRGHSARVATGPTTNTDDRSPSIHWSQYPESPQRNSANYRDDRCAQRQYPVQDILSEGLGEHDDLLINESTLRKVIDIARVQLQAAVEPRIQEMQKEIDRLQEELVRAKASSRLPSPRKLEGFGALFDALVERDLILVSRRRRRPGRL